MQCHKQLYLYLDSRFYVPDDNLLTGIKAILAEDFSRELSKKIKNAHKRRQQKGTGLNITVPIFGWDKIDKDVYALNDEEAYAYRLAFAMAEEGKGFYTIANEMYDMGVRSKRGGRISEVQWRKMLYSPRAHGVVALHTTEYDFETKQKKKIPESEWIFIENALPPIVSKEYQKKVLEKLKTRTADNHFSDYTRNMTKTGLYPLSGKIYCKECGKPYYRSKAVAQKEKVIAWKCSTFLKQGRKHGCSNPMVLERQILDELKQNISLDECSYLQKAEQYLEKVICDAENNKMRFSYRRKIESLECRKQVLLEKWLDGIVEDNEYRAMDEKIREQMEELQTETRQYIGSKERLENIKQVIETEIMGEAVLKSVLLDIDRIDVFPDGTLEFHFHKYL